MPAWAHAKCIYTSHTALRGKMIFRRAQTRMPRERAVLRPVNQSLRMLYAHADRETIWE